MDVVPIASLLCEMSLQINKLLCMKFLLWNMLLEEPNNVFTYSQFEILYVSLGSRA